MREVIKVLRGENVRVEKWLSSIRIQLGIVVFISMIALGTPALIAQLKKPDPVAIPDAEQKVILAAAQTVQTARQNLAVAQAQLETANAQFETAKITAAANLGIKPKEWELKQDDKGKLIFVKIEEPKK